MSVTRDWRYRLEAVAARALLRALSALPPGIAIALGNGAGSLSFRLWRKRRQIAIQNILNAGLCSTPSEAAGMARASFRTFTVMLVESFILRRRFTTENWRDHVTLCGSKESRQLLETPGQPLLMSSAHLGSWEAGVHVGSLIRPVALVHRPLSNPYLQKVAYEERAGNNVSLLSSLEPSPFRFLQALNSGKIVGLMTDQHASKHRVRVSFFGQPAWTTKTIAMMHLSTRVPLISAFCIRTGPLRYEIHFTDPVQIKRSGDREKDAHDLTQQLTTEIENMARQYPTQYMWGHRRWKP